MSIKGGKMTPDELIIVATKFYLKSKDFNGYPGHHIHRVHGKSYEDLKKLFRDLVLDGRGTIVFGDLHPNPHIRAFADESPEEQLRKLEFVPLEQACLYPSSQHLSLVVSDTDYWDRPFTRELALGAGQLEFRSFDLTILENYRNDPRYHYDNDDIRGQICVKGEFCESDQMHEKDQVILETFGFSYDEQMNRAVAAFLIYLSRQALNTSRCGTQSGFQEPSSFILITTETPSSVIGDREFRFLTHSWRNLR